MKLKKICRTTCLIMLLLMSFACGRREDPKIPQKLTVELASSLHYIKNFKNIGSKETGLQKRVRPEGAEFSSQLREKAQ